jgi:hypothetical protein
MEVSSQVPEEVTTMGDHPALVTNVLTFEQALLDAWNSNSQMLDSSNASEYLKAILTAKVGARPGTRRFFGEAFVSTRIEHQEGYYGSFQWLTNPVFASDGPFPDGPTKKFKEQYRSALKKHFGPDQLLEVMKNAATLEGLYGITPAAPDLWLVDRAGNHRFIEVKLPGDWIKEHQLAGLAVIGRTLHSDKQLSVEVFDLRPNDEAQYKKYCDAL